MSTGQTMMTIFAFVLLSTTLISFYRIMGASGDDIMSGQDGILETTIATSYMEIAQGLAYDEKTDTSNAAIKNLSALTLPAYLGSDDAAEDSIQNFDDFDDFNGFTLEKEAGATGRKYATKFGVYYVNQNDVSQIIIAPSFVKRMDLKTWRIFPPSSRADTLRLSLVMGYFHFD